ncbi:hypothetical protein PWEIH_09878 [Listeria weihenstephanensis FSL R9-0317]|uniref:Toxin-antitoxin system, antitoxin component n=1 Tax=Listeria weihenstephanensis TaxID=1006155 RepID=A0A1S7FY50_9LIST|nr:DUF6290 family protein [Listeria weihenstephanensis]AQY52309.1 toxin-antitoxin system, antitoxin component [Listeria weihenstephanensis]EUJ38297.1 hypothetical protein PWEIH_09878 [Listeria weihenstephanensis FSL R9-0317]
MATITVRVSDVEKQFLDEMAKFEGKSLSDLLKTTTLESLEDEYDARVADYAYEEYLKKPESRPLSELMSEYGLDDDE